MSLEMRNFIAETLALTGGGSQTTDPHDGMEHDKPWLAILSGPPGLMPGHDGALPFVVDMFPLESSKLTGADAVESCAFGRSSLPSAFARPKSVIQMAPVESKRRFEGFTSRCRIPWLWAYANASAA